MFGAAEPNFRSEMRRAQLRERWCFEASASLKFNARNRTSNFEAIILDADEGVA
jgi:hypothetical protein